MVLFYFLIFVLSSMTNPNFQLQVGLFRPGKILYQHSEDAKKQEVDHTVAMKKHDQFSMMHSMNSTSCIILSKRAKP